ncbi:MAG: hypothetical protein KUG81_00730 [Gammaproteobacteria bacterium]|nr:hypothetical protein [Gammaproteobacteria bacterium]
MNRKISGTAVSLTPLILTPLILIGLVVLAFIFTLLNKAYWDYRVKQMCEADGGVTVYEKVELTQEEYKKYGGIKGTIPVPGENSSIASQYNFLAKRSHHVIRSFNPNITKYEGVIYRNDDKKELGKMVTYYRSGGDFPTIIGHPSGFSCRDIPGFKLNIEQQIFSVKEN